MTVIEGTLGTGNAGATFVDDPSKPGFWDPIDEDLPNKERLFEGEKIVSDSTTESGKRG